MTTTQISAVLLENTFLSIPHVARQIPIIKYLRWVIHQRWSSYKAIARLPAATPICLLSGLRDRVVPSEHMRTLWEIAQSRGDGKERVESSEVQDVFKDFPTGDHRKSLHDLCLRIRCLRCSFSGYMDAARVLEDCP